MSISITAFTEGFFSYVQLHPTAFDDTEKTDLRALAKRTFENAEEAGFALAEFVERIQRSGKPEQTKIVQALFDQAIQRPLSAPPTEQSAEKQTRYETTPTETGILDPDSLAHIFSFLSLQTQGQVARLSHSCRDAMRLRRIFDLDPLYGSRFSLLFPLFGITLPPPNPSSSQVSAACKELLEKVTNILKDVKKSKALTDDEKKPFSTMDPLEIVHNPSLLHVLLHTAYEISLVSPFLEGRNDGPELPGSMTLEEKAETVRKHLKDNGNSYEKLSCKKCGMLCFPRELCSLQNLQKLKLSGNRLSTIPPEIGQLAKLRRLNLNNNHLTSLPEAIGGLTQLFNLNLNNNHLTSLPEAIGGLTQLSNLDLHNNHLTSLPEVIGGLTQLCVSTSLTTTSPPYRK